MARVAKKTPAPDAADVAADVAVPVADAPRPGESRIYFDHAWYEQQYPDVAAAGVDAATHYREFGWAENRWPSPHFSPFAYRAANPDLADYAGDLFLHYLFYGASEGRPLG